jgi:hypothetical protein
MFFKGIKNRIEDAERIIQAFETMLNFAHLSEDKSAAANFCRREIKEYKKKYIKENV